MDTGENKLSVEMMKKMYEAYKLHQKEDYEKFVEDCKKIIQVSDRTCPDTEDILKLVEGTPITDNHERRIHDPSIYKYHGRQILQAFFDEPYPVMMPEDEKMMRGMSNEIRAKFQDYVSKELGETYPTPGTLIQRIMSAKYLLNKDSIPDSIREKAETGIPRETITIDSIPKNVREKAEHDAVLYGDSFVSVNRAPRWVEQYLETQRWIDGIRDPEIDTITGCTQNFKMQSNTDKLEAYVKDVEAFVNLLDTSKPDRNGRIWEKDCLKKILIGEYPPVLGRGWVNLKDIFNDPYVQIIGGRSINRTLYSNIYQMMSYNNMAMSINQMWRLINRPFSTKWNINSVIHMHWSSPDLTDLKARDFRYGKMWEDQMLINYATGDVSPIDRMVLEGLATFGPDINSGYGLSTPNLNDIDKKKLERVIKRRKKK